MKKPYSLDYTIERDTDRLELVKGILDTLPNNPSPQDLEQMATYILYGKDENDNEILVDFYTSGNHVEFKDSFMAGLFIFLVKFENFATPLAIGFSESAYNDIVWKIRVAIFGGLEKILTLFVSG